MREIKYVVGVVVVCSCVATLISHCIYRVSSLKTTTHYDNFKYTTSIALKSISMKDVPLNKVVLKEPLAKLQMADDLFERQHPEMHILKTPGCKIPLSVVNYKKHIKIDRGKKLKCGERAVFLRKHDGGTLIATIKMYMLQKHMKFKYSNFYCCYQFLLDTAMPSKQHKKTAFSNCTKFKHNSKITLQSDFVDVKCYENTPKNQTFILYEDKYAFTKKRNSHPQPRQLNCKIKYNVMMIGLDSMSFYRAEQTLPRTLAYLSNQFWIGYKGYHKVADNTLPNLLAVCTGKNMNSIRNKCTKKMDICNRYMIWTAFKQAGYSTAYGEDDLDLPDTFTNDFEFKKPPTDHYMRPFFGNFEYNEKNGLFLCIGNISTGRQILDYALDFAQTYKNEPFFGLFWINTFSHNSKSRPNGADKMIENFFFRLNQTGVLSSTFVIFFSDHGIRFGELRFTPESYYDERLPMFFIWTPSLFKQQYPSKYRAIVLNQYRLVTPYDIYSTLLDIIKISTCDNKTVGPPEGCSNCHSIFQNVSPNRTCEDASISDRWCSCHKLYPLSVNDKEAKKNVYAVVNHLKSADIKTKKCWFCKKLGLKKIYRIHYYYHKNNISMYSVVAFSMSPANVSYEAIVFRNNSKSKREIVGAVSLINNYRGLGKCVINRYDRLFCICKKQSKCNETKN